MTTLSGLFNETRQPHSDTDLTICQPISAKEITVLTATGSQIQAKRWQPDGTTAPAATPKNFKRRVVAVTDIQSLSTVLTALTPDKQACVVRGSYIGDALAVPLMRALPVIKGETPWQEGHVLRQSAYFMDAPQHPVMLDVDGFKPTAGDPCRDTEACIDEFITKHLPDCFHGVSHHWQLSGSAGLVKNAGVLKSHLWFWLTTPYTSAELTAWAKAAPGMGLDTAVFGAVQPLYTAAPVMAHGVTDPVAVRSGFTAGLFSDAVNLVIDADLLAAANAPRATVALGSAALDDIKKVARGLDAIPNDLERGDWMRMMWATRDATGGSIEGFELFKAWTATYPGDDGSFNLAKWREKDDGGVTRRTLYKMANKCNPQWNALPIAEQVAGLEDVPDVTPAGGVPTDGALAPIGQRQLLPAFTRVTSSGKIEAEINNLIAALARPDICGFHVRYDTFRDGIMLAPVGSPGELRSIKDSDNVNMRGRLQKGGAGFQPIPKETFRDVIHSVAEANPFDSAQQWLGSLVWDGEPRVIGFLATYFAAGNTPYTRAVGLYMWSAMAGRVMVPGIKADMVPVLIGAQGARKSTAVAALVPSSDFFAAIDLAAPDADLARVMRSKLVIELDELKGLGSRESESIKSFITRPIDEWTPKYIEYVTKYPRRSVFFGTSNKDDILADDTGNRRWLPFRVGMCDVDGIARDREQLWAEARGLFASNGIMFAAAEQLAVAEHAEFAVHDELDSSIAKWLQGDGISTPPRNREFLSGSEIMTQALNVPMGHQSAYYGSRVKRAMIRLGYQAVNRRIDGQQLRLFAAPSLF